MADLHGWQSDPFGLHEERYFSQGQATKLVRDGGVEFYDPPPSTSVTPAGQVSADAQVTVPRDTSVGAAWASPSGPAPSTERSATAPDRTPLIRRHSSRSPPPPTSPMREPMRDRLAWWLASDGNWYPPEAIPAQPPPSPGWWLASDGNWYPPEARQTDSR